MDRHCQYVEVSYHAWLRQNQVFESMSRIRILQQLIRHPETVIEPQRYSSEPVLGGALFLPESRNCITDVALLVSSSSMFIGVAGFEGNRSRAEPAGDGPMRCVLGEACHDMILLADHGIHEQ